MTSTPVSQERSAKKPESGVVGPRGLTLGRGILWILGLAAAWTILLVLFHNVMARLLS